MSRELFSDINVRLLGLIAFIATGVGLIISTVVNEQNFYKMGILLFFGCFFLVGLVDYFKKLTERDDKNEV